MNITILSLFSNEYKILNTLVVSRVTTFIPNFRLVKTNWPYIHQIQLADPEFQKSSEIDSLLGADILYDILSEPPIYGNYGEPAATPTSLGDILSGKISMPNIFKINLHQSFATV